MGKIVNVTSHVEVEVDLSDISTEDLVEELKGRYDIPEFRNTELIHAIYEKRRLNQPYEGELDELICLVTGRLL